jgi:hypothetical protein
MAEWTCMIVIASVGLVYQDGYECSTSGETDFGKPVSHNS